MFCPKARSLFQVSYGNPALRHRTPKNTDERSAAARYLGARGARATNAKLTPEQRTENARKAGKASANVRWGPRPLTEAPPLAQEIVAAKPTRPPPKAGTMAARVLEIVRLGSPITLADIREFLPTPDRDLDAVPNALSSLRSAGHVVSEPKPGSRREKLWRLA